MFALTITPYGPDDGEEVDPEDPATYDIAMSRSDTPKWVAVIQDKLQSILDLKVWSLVPRATVIEEGRKILKGRFVFHLKRDQWGRVVRHKVCFVVKGCGAVPGVDFTKTTSPTMHMETYQVVFHIAAAMGWAVHQVDVKTVFLRRFLPPGEHVFMEQPKGFEMEGKENWIQRVVKGLYGMPNAGWVCYSELNDKMIVFGYTRIPCEHCLYYRKLATGKILATVHVDDYIAAVSDDLEAHRFKDELRSVWEISDLGIAMFCLGIAIKHDLANKFIFLSQTALIDKTLALFKMANSKPVGSPMEHKIILSRFPAAPLTAAERSELKSFPYCRLVGLLMYIAIGSRPDISLAVGKLCQFLDCYNYEHWDAVKHVLWYLRGTRMLRLRLGGSSSINIIGFTDASFACCPDTRKSVGAYCFTLGTSRLVSWSSRKQTTVAQSTMDSEYISAAESSREAVWLHQLLAAIDFPASEPTPILCDNKAANILSSDPAFRSRSKHIDVKYHYIREKCVDGSIIMQYVKSEDNVADILTKALPTPQFLHLRTFLGLHER